MQTNIQEYEGKVCKIIVIITIPYEYFYTRGRPNGKSSQKY